MTPNPYESPQTTSTLLPQEPRPIWDEVEVEIDLTLEDFIAFNVHHLQHSPLQRQAYTRRIQLLLLVVLGADVGLLAYRAQFQPLSDFDFLIHGAVGAAVLIGIGIRLFLNRMGWRSTSMFRRVIRNAMKHSDYSNILGPRRCRVTNELLENIAPLWESRWRLRCIQKIEVTPQYGFAYLSPNQAIIFPVRAFVSPDHFATFIANLEGHTGKIAERVKA